MNSSSPAEKEPNLAEKSYRSKHVAAVRVDATAEVVPQGRRIPFGWSDFAVPIHGRDGRTILHWPSDACFVGEDFRMRLAVSLDIREPVCVEARDPQDGTLIGVFDFTQAPVFQLEEILLSSEACQRIHAVGVELVATVGTIPPRFFAPSLGIPSLLQPHILIVGKSDPWMEFFERLGDLDLIQTFSWMEGCMLEGIYDLQSVFNLPRHSEGLQRRLDLYLRDDNLIYENPRSEPVDNSIYGIEATLPFAVISRVRPQHASVQRVLDFWLANVRPPGGFAAGCIQDGAMTSAEGSICVAYPILVIARQRGDRDLENLGLEQLRIRQQLLVDVDGSIFLRNHDGTRSFRNWARGIAWYFLGLVRGLIEVKDRDDIEDLRHEARRVMEYVFLQQTFDGLWNNFTDSPESGIDTSGSAGIAAALAVGYRGGILPVSARDAALRAHEGLGPWLTPDGLLSGGTPSNRSGRGSLKHRVIFPVAMGLAAQLIAALGELPDFMRRSAAVVIR